MADRDLGDTFTGNEQILQIRETEIVACVHAETDLTGRASRLRIFLEHRADGGCAAGSGISSGVKLNAISAKVLGKYDLFGIRIHEKAHAAT